MSDERQSLESTLKKANSLREEASELEEIAEQIRRKNELKENLENFKAICETVALLVFFTVFAFVLISWLVK